MPTFKKAPQSVTALANDILCRFASHKPLLDARVRIDIVMAYGDRDEKGELTSDAITKDRRKCLGLTKKIGLKDRVKGMGDVEVMLDGDWWDGEATTDQKAAVLDHELHHISIKENSAGEPESDDLSRPKIFLRQHDVQVGWFNIVAERHGENSMEQIQAKAIMDHAGQLYWPSIAR